MAYVRTRAEAGYLCAMKGVALPSVVPRFEDGSELRSLRSSPEEKVQLAFINTTPHTVECWWINNWGQPIYYGTMEPAGSEASGSVYLLESTFDTHPWMFVAPNAPDVTRWLEVRELNQHVAFPNKALPVMHLQLAQPMAWDPRNHKAHCEVHPEFKETVQTLLLVHNRLRNHPEKQELPPTTPPARGAGSSEPERKGLAPGWRLLCGLWLKRPKHQAAHGAGAEAAGASGAEAGPADAPWAAGAAAPQPFGLHGQPGLTLGDLPPELMLHAIKFLAPPAPQLRALTPADQDRDS